MTKHLGRPDLCSDKLHCQRHFPKSNSTRIPKRRRNRLPLAVLISAIAAVFIMFLAGLALFTQSDDEKRLASRPDRRRRPRVACAQMGSQKRTGIVVLPISLNRGRCRRTRQHWTIATVRNAKLTLNLIHPMNQ